MLPFGKYWNALAAKGTNSAAVIRQVLVHPAAAACYKLKQLPKYSLPLDENGQYGVSTRLTAIWLGPTRKKSGGTELAPPDPIFFTQASVAIKFHCINHKDFKLAVCFHPAVEAPYTYQTIS